MGESTRPTTTRQKAPVKNRGRLSVSRTEPRLPVPEVEQVVMVEGSPELAEMLEYGLTNAGVSCRIFLDAREAFEYLLETRDRGSPVVLLDLDLQGLDGFASLERLKRARPDYVVVVMSAQGADRDQIRALKAGAVDYLVKPVSIPVLVAKIERMLADRSGP